MGSEFAANPARSHAVTMPLASSSTSCLRLWDDLTAMANVKPRSNPSRPSNGPCKVPLWP